MFGSFDLDIGKKSVFTTVLLLFLRKYNFKLIKFFLCQQVNYYFFNF